MAGEPQGNITFPGLVEVMSADMTFSPGISPSICLVRMAPQKKPLDVIKPGELKFTYDKEVIKFPDALVDSGSLEISGDGQTWSIRIKDRRWKWEFGEVSGRYNYRRADGAMGEIEAGTEKTPRELAKILLEAMGETVIGDDQIKTLPNESRPEVEWDFDNPAQALASLCDMLGCRVCLGLDNKVWIRKNGDGKLLPVGGKEMNAGIGIVAKVRPALIKIVCGPTKFQVKFELEAVGEDVDGRIKLVDDLSYKPAAGWGSLWPDEMEDIQTVYTKLGAGVGVIIPLMDSDFLEGLDPADPADALVLEKYAFCRDLAAKTVYRWYRVKQLAEGGLIPKGGVILLAAGGKMQRKHLLPIDDTLVETTFDDEGTKRFKPAYVEGTFFDDDLTGTNTEPFRLYRGGFSINREKGIVMFADPVYRLNDKADPIFAQMYLTCSTSARFPADGGILRHQEVRELKVKGGLDNGLVRIVKHDEIVHTLRTTYNAGKAVGLANNTADVQKECKHYLDALEKEYTTEPSGDVEYAGLVGKPVEPDGAIQQVTWTISESGTTTRASRNAEHAIFTPTFEEMRRREKRNQADRLADTVVRTATNAALLVKRFMAGKF